MIGPTCTSFATRLRFDLYTFWEIFGWVWLWSLCVQQFWACKFMVSWFIVSPMRWSEEKWGDERRVGWYFGVTLWRSLYPSVWSDDIFGHLVAECECVEFDYLETETELMYVREWPQYYRERSWFGWWPNCCVSSVSPYLRLLRSAILHTKELCRIYNWQCSVIDSSSSVVWLFVLCELEFFRVHVVHYVSYVGHNFFWVRSVKPYEIVHYSFVCIFVVFKKNPVNIVVY